MSAPLERDATDEVIVIIHGWACDAREIEWISAKGADPRLSKERARDRPARA
jgi:hypothetical protein